MKKIYIMLLLALCCTSGMFGQTNHAVANGLSTSLERQIMTMIEKYCENIEKISSTSGQISNEEKIRIRRENMPKLFYQYDMRRVSIETNKGKNAKRLHDYLYNLQRQAGMQRPGKERMEQQGEEELVFVFYTNMDLNIPQTAFIDGGNVNAEYRMNTPEPIIMENYNDGMKRKATSAVKKPLTVTPKGNIIIYHIWNAKDVAPFMLLGDVYIINRK